MFVPRSQRCRAGRRGREGRAPRRRPRAPPATTKRRRRPFSVARAVAALHGEGDGKGGPGRRPLPQSRDGPRTGSARTPARPPGEALGGEGPRARNGPRGRPGAAPVPRSPPASGRRAPDIRVFSPPNGCWPSCDRRGDRPMVEMRPPSHRPIRVAGSLGRAARPKEGAGERPAGPDDGAGPEGSAARCRQATRHDPSRVRRRGPPPARPPDRCVLR